jgi:hypothetical protein
MDVMSTQTKGHSQPGQFFIGWEWRQGMKASAVCE